MEEQYGFSIALGQKRFSQKFEVVHCLIVFREFKKSGNGDFFVFLLDVNANVNLILDDVLDKVSDLLFSIFHDFVVLFLRISSEEIRDVNTASQSFFGNVR